MGRGRATMETNYLATLTRLVSPPDTSIYVDTQPAVSPPFYVTLNPLATSEIVYVTVVNEITPGVEYEFTGLTRNLPGSEDQTHLVGSFAISAYNQDLHNDLWDEVVALQDLGTVEITPAMSPYTVQPTDQILVCPTNTGPITINLPSAAANPGRGLLIQQFGGINTVTIDPNGGDGITNLDGNTVFLKTLSSPSALWAAYAHPNAAVWMTTGENGTIS